MNDMPAKTSMFSDLTKRLVSAVVLIVVGLAALWGGGYAWTALVLVAAGIMAWELHSMVPKNPNRADAGLAVSVITAGSSVILTHALGLVTGMMAPLAGVLMLGAIDSKRYLRLALGVYYIAMASVGLVAMRDGANGFWVVLWLILIVVATDTGGYFAGRMIGGPKLWVKISPKKTWAGTIGGWVLAVGASLAFAQWMGWNLPVLALLALILSIASQAGDLAESAVKRAVGVKDSSNLIPGHGGLLDRFDALMGASMMMTIFGLASYVH